MTDEQVERVSEKILRAWENSETLCAKLREFIIQQDPDLFELAFACIVVDLGLSYSSPAWAKVKVLAQQSFEVFVKQGIVPNPEELKELTEQLRARGFT